MRTAKIFGIIFGLAVFVLLGYIGIRIANNKPPTIDEFTGVVINPERYYSAGSYFTFKDGVVVAGQMSNCRYTLNIAPYPFICRGDTLTGADIIVVVIDALGENDIPVKVGDYVEVRGYVKRSDDNDKSYYYIDAHNITAKGHIELGSQNLLDYFKEIRKPEEI